MLCSRDERLHDASPRAREILAIVATAAGPDDPPFAVFVGQPAQRRSRVGVRLFGVAQVSNRVAFEAIGAALQDDEFGSCVLEVGLDPRPGAREFRVAGARRQSDVELGATCPALPVPVSLSAPVPG